MTIRAQATSETYLPPEEYLALERAAEVKSEYLDGDMIAMPGSSREHNLIVTNLVAELHQQLKGRPAEVYPGDLKVWIPTQRSYTYPDVCVVTNEPRLQDDHGDILLNPELIIEVLSPGTESYDRGKKFEHYRSIDSLGEYVLVNQVERRVEQYVRQHNGQWLFSEMFDFSGIVSLPSVRCELPMTEIYHKVPRRAG